MSEQQDRGHRIRRMSGRSTDEPHRAATPLELLFDLTFVVAFSFAGNAMTHELVGGHYAVAIVGFALSMFAICWAWINFTWFASAFDNDDWLFRLTTMCQMVGVLILALGVAPLIESVQSGEHVDNRAVVLGYVVMRVALVFQWLRVAVQVPGYRATARRYAIWLLSVQVAWVLLSALPVSIREFVLGFLVLIVVELLGPAFSERRGMTPWHAHHIAERYSLLAIIALGEVILGTIEALRAVVAQGGWSWQVAVIGLAGVGLCFGLWWTYFKLPSAEVLHRFRGSRSFVWGYGHIVVFGAIAATGAGLHVAALYLQEQAAIASAAADSAAGDAGHGISRWTAVLAVAIPVTLYFLALYALNAYLLQTIDRMHMLLLIGAFAAVASGVLLAALHAPLGLCLAVIAAAPLVTVAGYEIRGHRRHEEFVDRL